MFSCHLHTVTILRGQFLLMFLTKLFYCRTMCSSSSAVQLFMSFGLLNYFFPFLPLLRRLFPIIHSPTSSSSHSSRRPPILLLAFPSVLLHSVSICIWSWSLFHWSFFLHAPTSPVVCILYILLYFRY